MDYIFNFEDFHMVWIQFAKVINGVIHMDLYSHNFDFDVLKDKVSIGIIWNGVFKNDSLFSIQGCLSVFEASEVVQQVRYEMVLDVDVADL